MRKRIGQVRQIVCTTKDCQITRHRIQNLSILDQIGNFSIQIHVVQLLKPKKFFFWGGGRGGGGAVIWRIVRNSEKMDSLILELSSVCNELWKIFSCLVFLKAFREHICILLYNEASLCFCFYCLFSYSHCEMGILLKGAGGEFLQSPNRSSARWRYFITTTRNLHGFAFLCKLELLLFKLRWDYQIYKNEKNRMTSLCKWPVTCTSKDKHGDRSKFF